METLQTKLENTRDLRFKNVHPVKSGKTGILPKAKLFDRVKVVGFDFDDTLVDEQYSIRQRWKKVLGDYDFLSSNLKEKFFEIYQKKGPDYKFHLDDTLDVLKIGKKFKNEILLKLRQTFESEKLLDGAKDLLEYLRKKGLKAVIITDGRRSYQKGRIRKAGIYKYFEFVIYGNGKKEPKPNKQTLEKIKKYMNKIKAKFPEEFLFVGNGFKNDIEGFANLGAKAYLVTKDNNLKKLWKKEF